MGRAADERIERVSPGELAPGDLVLVESEPARVLEEPMAMHRGLGLFDEFQMLVGVRLQRRDPARLELRVWAPDARVPVRRRAEAA